MKGFKLPDSEQRRISVFFLLLATALICVICLCFVCAQHYIAEELFARILPLSLILGAALIALAINTKHTS